MPRTGIEPVTLRSSVLRSPNWAIEAMKTVRKQGIETNPPSKSKSIANQITIFFIEIFILHIEKMLLCLTIVACLLISVYCESVAFSVNYKAGSSGFPIANSDQYFTSSPSAQQVADICARINELMV